MNCLSNAPSYAAALIKRASKVISRSYLNGSSISTSISYRASQNSADCNLGVKLLTTDRVRCYSSKRSSKTSSKVKNFASSQPEEPNLDKNTFFVVRKGDLVGVYRNSSDCLAQVGSSFPAHQNPDSVSGSNVDQLCDPPVSVYKGHALPKDTEDYLVSLGLKNAIYTIRAIDLKDDMFGNLSPFSLQEPASSIGNEEVSPVMVDEAISQTPAVWIEKTAKLGDDGEKDVPSCGDSSSSCTLSFDGASKGNPGKAGAGAVLRSVDGNLICKLYEGAGSATCNVAEYRGIILGLRHALEMGYTKIQVQGDSKLICMQVKGLWKVKNENLATLHEVVTELKQKFHSFEICNVPRARNSEADVLANKGINLADGEIEEECVNAIQIA